MGLETKRKGMRWRIRKREIDRYKDPTDDMHLYMGVYSADTGFSNPMVIIKP